MSDEQTITAVQNVAKPLRAKIAVSSDSASLAARKFGSTILMTLSAEIDGHGTVEEVEAEIWHRMKTAK